MLMLITLKMPLKTYVCVTTWKHVWIIPDVSQKISLVIISDVAFQQNTALISSFCSHSLFVLVAPFCLKEIKDLLCGVALPFLSNVLNCTVSYQSKLRYTIVGSFFIDEAFSDIFFHPRSMSCRNSNSLKQSVHVESEHLHSISSLAIITSNQLILSDGGQDWLRSIQRGKWWNCGRDLKNWIQKSSLLAWWAWKKILFETWI